MMYLIFSFSGQTGDTSSELSYKVSCKVIEIQGAITGQQYDDYTISVKADAINYKVRKVAHMTEYFLLAVAVSFPFYVYGLRGLPLVILAMGICVGFAGLDEYHQSFVAGRGPSKRDVLIDSCGALIGVMAVRLFCWIFLGLMPGRKKRRKNWTFDHQQPSGFEHPLSKAIKNRMFLSAKQDPYPRSCFILGFFIFF